MIGLFTELEKEREVFCDMSTRAIVIDSRVKGKGFWIRHDGYPAGLGVDLKSIFSKSKSIEQVCLELINLRTERDRVIASRTGTPFPDINGGIMSLTFEQVELCKKSGANALWNQFGIDAAYSYKFRSDGVYVVGGNIPKFRKVQAYETIRS